MCTNLSKWILDESLVSDQIEEADSGPVERQDVTGFFVWAGNGGDVNRVTPGDGAGLTVAWQRGGPCEPLGGGPFFREAAGIDLWSRRLESSPVGGGRDRGGGDDEQTRDGGEKCCPERGGSIGTNRSEHVSYSRGGPEVGQAEMDSAGVRRAQGQAGKKSGAKGQNQC